MQMDRRGSQQTASGSGNGIGPGAEWPPSHLSHSRTRSIPALYASQSNPGSPIAPSSPLASVDMLLNQTTGFMPSHGRNRSMGQAALMSPTGSIGAALGAEHEWADIQARYASS